MAPKKKQAPSVTIPSFEEVDLTKIGVTNFQDKKIKDEKGADITFFTFNVTYDGKDKFAYTTPKIKFMQGLKKKIMTRSVKDPESGTKKEVDNIRYKLVGRLDVNDPKHVAYMKFENDLVATVARKILESENGKKRIKSFFKDFSEQSIRSSCFFVQNKVTQLDELDKPMTCIDLSYFDDGHKSFKARVVGLDDVELDWDKFTNYDKSTLEARPHLASSKNPYDLIGHATVTVRDAFIGGAAKKLRSNCYKLLVTEIVESKREDSDSKETAAVKADVEAQKRYLESLERVNSKLGSANPDSKPEVKSQVSKQNNSGDAPRSAKPASVSAPVGSHLIPDDMASALAGIGEIKVDND